MSTVVTIPTGAWGPDTWITIHRLCYEAEKANITREELIDWLFALCSVLPCVYCRMHFSTELRQGDLPKEVNKFFEWSVIAHARVSHRVQAEQEFMFVTKKKTPDAKWIDQKVDPFDSKSVDVTLYEKEYSARTFEFDSFWSAFFFVALTAPQAPIPVFDKAFESWIRLWKSMLPRIPSATKSDSRQVDIFVETSTKNLDRFPRITEWGLPLANACQPIDRPTFTTPRLLTWLQIKVHLARKVLEDKGYLSSPPSAEEDDPEIGDPRFFRSKRTRGRAQMGIMFDWFREVLLSLDK